MKKYKVILIREQDYGCEEPPEEYTVDVILKDMETNTEITVSSPDAKLYNDNIDIGSIVSYDGINIKLS